jgi:hypothetical protein
VIAVYPYKHNGRHDHELRFSLRALAKNAKWCDGVLLIGDKPDWYTGHHIGHQGEKQKFSDVQVKLGIACAAMDAEHWVVMNDDMYLMQEQHDCAVFHGPPLNEKWQDYGGRYRDATVETMRIVGGEFPTYGLHCPLPVATEQLQEALELCNGSALYRTVYAWIASGHGSSKLGRFSEDFKAHNELQIEGLLEKPWFSTKEQVVSEQFFLKPMRERFPDPSPWEG